MTFGIAACVLAGGVGAYLAVNLDVGPYAFTYSRPGACNSRTIETLNGHHVFVQTPEGARFGRPISAHDWPMPEGVILGSVAFEVEEDRIGFPEPVCRDWFILTMKQIEPSPDGPPASDRRAWNRILAESLAESWPVPAALLAGDSTATGWSAANFAYDAGWRLLHAPTWLGPCLLAALVPATITFIRADRPRRRLRRGQCPACGYDLRGLSAPDAAAGPPLTCPECGGIAATKPEFAGAACVPPSRAGT